MQWGCENSLIEFYQKCIKIRKNSKALCTGTYETLICEDKNEIYGFARKTKEETIVVIMNMGEKEQKITIPGAKHQWLDVFSVREHDSAATVHLHLAVSAVNSIFTIDVNVFHPTAQYLAGLDVGDDEHSVVSILNVHASSSGERGGAGHDVIYVGGQFHSVSHLLHRRLGVGGVGHESDTQ